MSNDRAIPALARSDMALARIDAALGRIESAPRAADPAADVRHARLRTAAQAAVSQLDTLIAGGAR